MERPDAEETQVGLPTDLLLVVTLTVLSCVVIFVPIEVSVLIRAPLGILLALFLPGYALVAALFPRRMQSEADETSGFLFFCGKRKSNTESNESRTLLTLEHGIDGLERLIISVAASTGIVVLVSATVAVSPYGFRLVPVTLAVAGFTLIASLVAGLRRRRVPPTERYRDPVSAYGSSVSSGFRTDSRIDSALNVVLVAVVLLAVGSVAYSVTTDEVSSTEFYLLTETEDGRFVADDYPTEFDSNESRPLVVGIENNEGTKAHYTIVVELQHVASTENGVRVLAERELSRFSTTVPANGTRLVDYRIRPTMTGRNLRLAFLLYAGDPPDEPTVENAYRETHLFVNVTA